MRSVRLHQGTDLASANELLAHGLDVLQAARYDVSGEFWASTNPADADWFARTNPASGPPARFDFDVPAPILRQLLAQGLGIDHPQPNGVHVDYEFLPGSYAVLNHHMTNKQVISLP